MKIIMREAEREIERALFKEVLKRLHHNKDRVRRRLESSLRTWANDSPAVRSLQDDTFNSLKGTFGLTDEVASEAAVDIAKAVGNCLDVQIKEKKDGFSVSFGFVSADFRELLSLSSASFVTEKGTTIDWLSWLLTEGDKIIVSGYDYVPSPTGRSGLGFMRAGSAWRVPPQYSGTALHNFVSRLFEGKDSELTKILLSLLD